MHEAEIAIHLSRPEVLDVKLVRLGRMHLMFFAGQKYIETYERSEERCCIGQASARDAGRRPDRRPTDFSKACFLVFPNASGW
jgi:hypothetical protein